MPALRALGTLIEEHSGLPFRALFLQSVCKWPRRTAALSRVPWPGLGSCRPSGLGWLHLDPSWGEGVGAPGTQHTSCGERRCLHRCPRRTRGPGHCVTGGAPCSWALTPPCCPGPHPHPQQLLACHLDVPLCLSWVCSVGGPAWGTGGHVASEVPLSSRHGPWAAVCPPWGCRAAHRPPWALGGETLRRPAC